MSEKPGNKQQASHDSHAVAAPAPLGGARADFVASLGRKANDARNVLGVVLAERGTANERAPREELRRKLHALNVSARMLHFDVMAQSLAEAEDRPQSRRASRARDGRRPGDNRPYPRRPPRPRVGRRAARAGEEAERSPGRGTTASHGAPRRERNARRGADRRRPCPRRAPVRVRADRRRAGGDRARAEGGPRDRGHRRRRGRRRGARRGAARRSLHRAGADCGRGGVPRAWDRGALRRARRGADADEADHRGKGCGARATRRSTTGTT